MSGSPRPADIADRVAPTLPQASLIGFASGTTMITSGTGISGAAVNRQGMRRLATKAGLSMVAFRF